MKVRTEAMELPPLISVEEACKVLGIGRSGGYRAAAAGELPTLRLGRRLYVPTAKLLEMLGLDARCEERRVSPQTLRSADSLAR